MTHFFFGVLFIHLVKLNPLFLFFCVLPDIDIPDSSLGKIFSPFSERVFLFFGHRSITHSILFALTMGVCLSGFNLFWEAFLGILSHSALDMLTYSGVKIFYPYNKNYTFLDRTMLVGSKEEHTLLFIILILVIFGFFYK